MAKQDQIASLFAAVGFKIDQRSIASLNKQLGLIEARINRIKNSMSGAASTKNYGSAFKGMERQALGAATGIDSVTKRLQAGLGPLRAYTHAAQTLAYTFGVIRSQSPRTLPRTPSTGSRSPSGRRSGGGRYYPTGSGGFLAETAAGLFGGGGSALARGFLPGLGAGWAIQKIVQGGRRGIAQETAFTALSGSKALGMAETQWGKGLANTLGIDQNDVLDQYKGLFAATRGKAKLAGQARNIFKGFSEYGAALQIDPERMKGGLVALTQMASKGKIMSEELYGQMSEQLPGAAQIFAKVVAGGDEAKLREMLKDGEVTADVLNDVANEMARVARQGDALKTAMASSRAEQARFNNAWSEFLIVMNKSGVDKGLATFFRGLTSSLESFAKLAPAIGQGIGAIGAVLGPVLQLLTDFIDLIDAFYESSPKMTLALAALATTLYVLSGGMGAVVRAITVAFGALYANPAILGFIAVMLTLQDLIYWMIGRGSVMGDIFGKFDNYSKDKGGKDRGGVGTAANIATKSIRSKPGQFLFPGINTAMDIVGGGINLLKDVKIDTNPNSMYGGKPQMESVIPQSSTLVNPQGNITIKQTNVMQPGTDVEQFARIVAREISMVTSSLQGPTAA